MTSIASSTILSNSSSLFVLVFSYLIDRTTTIKLQQVIGVLITILGVVLISLKDMQANDSTENGKGDDGESKHGFTGDAIATLGAIFYGFYTVLLKVKIPDDSLLEMELLFGFLGFFNAVVFWPCFFIFHLVGIESFAAPPAKVILFLTINGIFGTVISDFLWAKSVLLTSPLIASLGLALTIPLAIIVDWFLHDIHFTVLYFIGGLAVLFGFILVNLVHSRESVSDPVESSILATQSLETSQVTQPSSNRSSRPASPRTRSSQNESEETNQISGLALTIEEPPLKMNFHDISLTGEANQSPYQSSEEDDDDDHNHLSNNVTSHF